MYDHRRRIGTPKGTMAMSKSNGRSQKGVHIGTLKSLYCNDYGPVRPLNPLHRIRNWALSTTSHVIWLSFHPKIDFTLNPRGDYLPGLPTYSTMKCTSTSRTSFAKDYSL